ncbi:MAG: glycosyltransferase family 1 protein [Gemmatimonadaceae bacterium]
MGLTIAFNGQRLAGQRLGVGRYIEYMLRHWVRQLGPDEELSLFLRRPLEDDLRLLHPKLHPVLLESGMSGIPWENLRLRGPASKTDVLFCPAYTGPIAYGGKMVVATHSVNEVHPEIHTDLKEQLYVKLFRHCARRADRVIVPAAVTRDAVMEQYGVPSERIAIIPQGADDVFQPVTDPEILRAVRMKYFGADRPYLLFVGKCSVRRNIPMLVRAFAELKATHKIPHGLLLFGPNQHGLPLEELCRELGVTGDVVQTDGKVDKHSDLVPIYAGADVFVHPSTFEGWSITTVEAMACGTAVVAADRGGLGEVARGHALMIADPTVDALVDAIARVLGDDALRRDLQVRARARGQALSWSVITKQTLQVVRDVARGSQSLDPSPT